MYFRQIKGNTSYFTIELSPWSGNVERESRTERIRIRIEFERRGPVERNKYTLNRPYIMESDTTKQDQGLK